MTKRNILFLVTGMTPQIITETVWALACDPENDTPWIPDEIHVLSTESGLDQIRSRLFSEKEGYRFAQFKQDYPILKNLAFDERETHLHSITDSHGTPLSDLKTPEDNEYAANAICQMIKTLTQKDNVALHVSIAGGRKTMGFYAGYALSLYGRAQDSISHVLVDERYESAKDFFYPSPKDNDFITNRDGKALKSKDAQIWLAEIPFVRMKEAIKEKHQLNRESNLTEVIHKINASFSPVQLTISVHNKTIEVNGQFTIKDLPPVEFAFLHWFADKRKKGEEGIIFPTQNMTQTGMSKEQMDYISKLTAEFMLYYSDHKNEDIETSTDKKFFQITKSKLNSSLITSLGLELAAKIDITQDKKGQPFYLNIAPDNIRIIDAFE